VTLPPRLLPALDRPALAPADGTSSGPVLPPRTPEAMVKFLDGTWRLCKVLGWRQETGAWAVELQWGVAGRIASGWYVYDTGRMTEAG